MIVTRGLIIKPHWLNLIWDGSKDWEIRGSRTHIRGTIGLIPSGSGLVTGLVDLVDVIPLSLSDFTHAGDHHQIPLSATVCLPYRTTYAWIFRHPHRFQTPRPYTHPHGAVIWVRLAETLLELPHGTNLSS